MKNTIAVLTVVGLMVVALPVSASVNLNLDATAKSGVKTRLFDRSQNHADGHVHNKLHGSRHGVESANNTHPFMIMGQVKSVSSDQLVIKVVNGTKGETMIGDEILVKIDASTRIVMHGEKLFGDGLSALVGQNVLVKAKHSPDGEEIASDEPAQMVIVAGQKQRVFGEITAASENSVTIKNNRTGESQTIDLNSDTKVKINGEDSTTGDIKSGDKAMIKIKATVNGWIAKAMSIFR